MTYRSTKRPIAVIGMSCRFPGANGVRQFWDLLKSGRDAIREVPDDRFDIDAFYDPRPGQSGKIITRMGGFLEEIRRFDASFFGISGREASGMDPQQRLLLEVAFEALEDGGQRVEELEGTATGVFVGMIANEYRERAIRNHVEMDVYSESGTTRAAASGRISHAFGLNGPSLTVDTACSSSLVATHLACESIWSGMSDMAIVGGTNLILEPESCIAFSSTGMLASDGRCKFGDASADGFVRSDGVGSVVLKPLDRALEEGDPVRAVVRETASNNDGRSGEGFFLTPSREGQRHLLEEIYGARRRRGYQVDYVEAHGTGTNAGDPVEIGALSDVLTAESDRSRPLYVGSVKTNIGHTEGAAGVAGLIKTVLTLENRLIPESLHFEEPNPDISWDEFDVRVPTESRAIEANRPIAAGVSSFGIAGTNAHVLVEEWRGRGAADRVVSNASRTFVLPISAHTDEALQQYVRRYDEFLPDADEEPKTAARELTDICFTAAVRRGHRRHRRTLVGDDVAELRRAVSNAIETHSDESTSAKAGLTRRNCVFVFSGQGGQWDDMGRAMLEEAPEFGRALHDCDEAISAIAGWSPVDTLLGNAEWTDDVSRVQPLIFSVQVALARAWSERGLTPDAVVGHSLGEVAAAHVAGILSLEDAARVICVRSALLKRISGEGSMAVVGLEPDATREAIGEFGDRVSVAVHNSPASTVVSGDCEAIEEIRNELDGRDIFCKPVDVDVASHSPQVAPLLPELRRELEGISASEGSIPIISTVRASQLAGEEFGPAYWADNLRRPVRLTDAVTALVERDFDTYIEISPHPVLSHPIRQTLRDIDDTHGVVVPALRRQESPSRLFAEGVAELYEHGYDVDWSQIHSDGVPVRLPRYPFCGEAFWFDGQSRTEPSAPVRRRSREEFDRATDRHPFLARHFTIGSDARLSVWEMPLTIARYWYLDEHRVRGAVIFPGAAFTEMALAAAAELFGEDQVVLEGMSFDDVLMIPDDAERRLQLIAEEAGPERYEIDFHSFDADDSESGASGAHHATAAVLSKSDATDRLSPPVLNGTDLTASGASLVAADFYEAIHGRGIDNGPAFQAIDVVRYDEKHVEGELEVPESILPELDQYVLHPCVLDGIFQMMGPLVLAGADGTLDGELFLPSGIGRLVVHRPLSRYMRGVAVRRDESDQGVVEADIRIFDELGEPVVDIEEFGVRRVRRESSRDDPVADWFYEWSWESESAVVNLVPVERDESVPSGWVIFSDGGHLGERVVAALENRGERCVTVERSSKTALDGGSGGYAVDASTADVSHYCELFEKVAADEFAEIHGVVFLWSSETLGSQVESSLAATRVAAALASADSEEEPALWFLTAGARSVSGDDHPPAPLQATTWGLARVVTNECPDLRVYCVDLSREPSNREFDSLARELMVEDEEHEIALRDDSRFVHRLRQVSPEAPTYSRRRNRVKLRTDDQFELQRSEPSSIDELRLVPGERTAPSAQQIEIDVKATGLNFADVVTAMGLMEESDKEIGYECVGEVTRVGREVGERLQPGMRVMAFAPSTNCFGGFATLHAGLAVQVPEALSFRQAATIPSVYLTAFYALIEEGRLTSNERVLIHSASGGVGHAALNIARRVGAEIFATAGTEEKRDYLRSEFGLEHVMDSRSLDFAGEIDELTDGDGIDVVLNTLTGEGTRRGLEILKPLGRFLDLSSAGMYEDGALDLGPFDKNLSYVGIDITKVAAHRPQLVASMWKRIFRGFEADDYGPVPIDSVFETPQLRDAFRYMRRGVHIGKIVVEQDFDVMEVERPVDRETLFREDGSYLLTGGTGGLGLEVADWMSRRGAGRLILLSRSGADARAEERIEAIRERGTDVSVERGDVTERARMATLVDDLRRGDAPLRGVFHLAAVLDDATIANQTPAKFERAFGAKAEGARILHELTVEDPIDYFVLFSSAASVIGSPGQSNYAAANAYLDALARQRRAGGMPALSINWGGWTEVGLAAARDDRGSRLEARGLIGISPDQGLEALERALLRKRPPQVGIFGLDWSKWAEAFPRVRESKVFAAMLPDAPDDERSDARNQLVVELQSSNGEDRENLVADYLREEVSDVLGMSATNIDFGQPVSRIGLDSLMVVELRVRLENNLGIELSGNTILRSQDLNHLTHTISDELERV